METLIELDESLFFFLNGLHSPWMDTIMYYASEKYTWLPLYAFLLALIIREYGWQTIAWLVAIALAITLADQITSGFMKPFFERFRPSRDPEFAEGLVHIVNDYRGGRFGFASSHAANSFATATILHLILRPAYRYTGWLFVFAAFVSYSRIYLGVHYPGDVLVGGLIGAGGAWLSYTITRKVMMRLQASGVE